MLLLVQQAQCADAASAIRTPFCWLFVFDVCKFDKRLEMLCHTMSYYVITFSKKHCAIGVFAVFHSLVAVSVFVADQSAFPILKSHPASLLSRLSALSPILHYQRIKFLPLQVLIRILNLVVKCLTCAHLSHDFAFICFIFF
jgi:hypothetical protein